MWTNRQRIAMPLRVYFSHPIRGTKGAAATDEDMAHNIERAAAVVKALRLEFGPALEIYFPGEMDEFVQKAFRKGYITEQQILDIDCDIIADRDAMLIWTWEDEISGGMEVEFEYTLNGGIPHVWVVTDSYNEDGIPVDRINYEVMRRSIGVCLDIKALRIIQGKQQ